MTIEIQNMIAKLNALESMQSCPACGNDTWETQTRLVSMPTVVDDRINPMEGLPCLARLCTHCGYVALHATEMLKKR